MLVRDLHVVSAWIMILSNGAVGVWALAAAQLPVLRTRALWWAVAAAELSVFVLVGLGVAAMQVEGYEPAQFHMFYGFVAIIAVAIIYAYRQQMEHRLHLLYGLGSLFVMGLGIRALLIGAA